MDTILELRGFWRKHVPKDGSSLFRALSDLLYGTQKYRFILQHGADLLQSSKIVKQPPDAAVSDPKYSLLCQLGQKFNFGLEIISSTDSNLNAFFFKPPDHCGFPTPILKLCHTPPNQFDPVYVEETISNSGFVQSILYELLYVKVFHVIDAMEAADYMLNGYFEDGKPENLTPAEFTGSALDALDNHLIPFPYKVAKCLDPFSYRNIEFDVWTVEKQEIAALKKLLPRSDQRTIGNLPQGTPCTLRYHSYGAVYGFVQKPTNDHKMMEVYIPMYEQCVYVTRDEVMPLSSTPREIRSLPRYPQDSHHFRQAGDIARKPVIDDENPLWRNLRMARSDDPNWLEKSNFSVPPPPMYPSLDLDDHDEVVVLREDVFDDEDDEEEERKPFQPLVTHQHRPPNLELQIPSPSTLDCDQNCFYCLQSCSAAATPSLVASPAMPLTPQFVLPFRTSLPNSPAPILVYSPLVATPVLPSTPLTPFIPQSLPSPFLSPLNVGDQQVFVYPSPSQMVPPTQSSFPFN